MFQFQSQPDTSQIGLLYALGLSVGLEGVDWSKVIVEVLQQIQDQDERSYQLKYGDFKM